MARKHNIRERNILDLTPVPSVEWQNKKDGTVFLLKPKFHNDRLKQWLSAMGVSAYRKIHLDEFGSHVWKQFNGKRSVSAIGESLLQEFGERINPVYERLAAFLRVLLYHKLICWKEDGK